MTKKVDLNGLDYNELQALIEEAKEKSHEKRIESLAAAVEVAKAELERRGFTLSDLIGFVQTANETSAKGKDGRKSRDNTGRKVAPKYRDPANPENTWTGRGIKPKWLTAKIAAGAKVEDFVIR